MEQRIEYKGMTSKPSDYQSEDGEMKLAVNAEYRDGGYHAVRVPKEIEFEKDGFLPKYVHKPKGSVNDIYIGCKRLSTGKYELRAICNDKEVDIENNEQIDSVDDVKDFCSIGNIVCFMHHNRILYYVYSNSIYRRTDMKEEPLKLYFAANRNNALVVGNDLPLYNCEVFVGKGSYEIVEYDPSGLYSNVGENADNAYIAALEKKRKELREHCELVFPVFVRYALRMYDGNYIYISPPILLHPIQDTIRTTWQNIKHNTSMGGHTTVDPHYSSVTVERPTIQLCSYTISMKITDVEMDKIKNANRLNGVIAGVDIFMSREIYTHKLDKVYAYYNSKTVDGTTIVNANVYFKQIYKWEKQFKELEGFFLVKSFTLDELQKRTTERYEDIFNPKGNEYGSDTLENYTERELLDESKKSYNNIEAEGLYSFNNRLLVWGNKDIYEKPVNLSVFVTPIISYVIYNNEYKLHELPDAMKMDNLYGKTGDVTDVRMIINKGGENVVVNVNCDTSYVPKYFYYDGSGATNLIYKTKDQIYNFNMEDCDFLRGSQCAFGIPLYEFKSLPEESAPSMRDTNIIKCSEVLNPFVFKDGNSVTCGNGKVLALASNVLPVSQGQFGQYTLFAFCSYGVSAISVGADGTLQGQSPYSYDIITGRDSLSNMERAIVFVTKQGIISLGGEGRQLLLPADPTATYDYDTCKGNHQATFIQKAFTNVLHLDAVPQMVDLYTYLTTGARIAYDYPNGRLIVYNQKHNYSYVMESASGMWSIMTQGFHSNLNVYEECLMVKEVSTAEGHTQYKVYNYSSDKVVEAQKAYLITRPFKLGYPDVHKTLHSLIQRGVFCSKDDVKQALYGSNDLYNWVPVWSSSNIYLRGFRGTGYKYYRLMLFLPEFKQNETLQGTTITFAPRMTDMQR
nr:MAG TPA: hypothetical protein [Caudoviricetes sp.]